MIVASSSQRAALALLFAGAHAQANCFTLQGITDTGQHLHYLQGSSDNGLGVEMIGFTTEEYMATLLEIDPVTGVMTDFTDGGPIASVSRDITYTTLLLLASEYLAGYNAAPIHCAIDARRILRCNASNHTTDNVFNYCESSPEAPVALAPEVQVDQGCVGLTLIASNAACSVQPGPTSSMSFSSTPSETTATSQTSVSVSPPASSCFTFQGITDKGQQLDYLQASSDDGEGVYTTDFTTEEYMATLFQIDPSTGVMTDFSDYDSPVASVSRDLTDTTFYIMLREYLAGFNAAPIHCAIDARRILRCNASNHTTDNVFNYCENSGSVALAPEVQVDQGCVGLTLIASDAACSVQSAPKSSVSFSSVTSETQSGTPQTSVSASVSSFSVSASSFSVSAPASSVSMSVPASTSTIGSASTTPCSTSVRETTTDVECSSTQTTESMTSVYSSHTTSCPQAPTSESSLAYISSETAQSKSGGMPSGPYAYQYSAMAENSAAPVASASPTASSPAAIATPEAYQGAASSVTVGWELAVVMAAFFLL